MKRYVRVALPTLVGLIAAVSVSASAASSAAAASHASGKLVIDNESGATWTCQFNPFNPAVSLTSFGFVYEPLEYVDILAKSTSSQVTPWLATLVEVVEWLQDADLHDAQRRQVERRHAAHGRGRRVHLQRDEERQGDRPQRAVDSRRWAAHGRLRQGLDGHLQVQVGVAAVLLLRGRPDADRADAHLVEAQPEQAAFLHRHSAGRQRALQGLRAALARTSSIWPTPATGRASRATSCRRWRKSTIPRS